MSVIRFLALGAGQDVGRSCVLVTMGRRTIMFDCGMHMGYQDERRFPDFSKIAPPGPNQGAELTRLIDCVIITHFHLDHCGALPYLTEMCGYRGPIYMTPPTRSLCPLLLEDFRRLVVERRGESTPDSFFTLAMIHQCMGRVTPLNLSQVHIQSTVEANNGDDDRFPIEIRPFYAGHVLGAAMFWVRVGAESTVYTGDYNMTPDRHLGSAWLDLQLRPDLLITESTYATTLRESKRARERDFLRMVHGCVAEGGKVLIPVFALGRVQELAILVEEYWNRMGLDHIPIYFSAGMAESALAYYQVYLEWTSEKLKEEALVGGRNPFEFRHVRPFERHYADHSGPMVLFSSPGMLHSGTSLDIFKKWCGDERNLLIIPGFCVSGTVGAKLLAGQRQIPIDEMTSGGETIRRIFKVKMQIRNMSFSAHADARGIMQLIRICEPRQVVLVHGEAAKMTILKEQIIKEMGIPCFDPPNGQVLEVSSGWLDPIIGVDVDELVRERRKEIELIANTLREYDSLENSSRLTTSSPLEQLIKERAQREIIIPGQLNFQVQAKEKKKSPALLDQQLILDIEDKEQTVIDDTSVDMKVITPIKDQTMWASFNGRIPSSIVPLLQTHLGAEALVTFYEELEALRVKSFILNMNNGDFEFRQSQIPLVNKIVQFLFPHLDSMTPPNDACIE